MKQEQRILRVVTKIFAPLILLFGLYVQFHGDYGPGGGFQAGVIFATALILYALVFGLDAARDVLPMRWVRALLPAGVLLYGGTGVYSLLAGYNFLDYTAIDPSDPPHGQHLGRAEGVGDEPGRVRIPLDDVDPLAAHHRHAIAAGKASGFQAGKTIFQQGSVLRWRQVVD